MHAVLDGDTTYLLYTSADLLIASGDPGHGMRLDVVQVLETSMNDRNLLLGRLHQGAEKVKGDLMIRVSFPLIGTEDKLLQDVSPTGPSHHWISRFDPSLGV